MALKLGSNIDLRKVVRSLGQKYILVPHLDLEIGNGEFEWQFDFHPKVTDDAWHPSSDCVPSLHELYQKANGTLERESFGAGLLKTFMVGHFWHQYLQWIVEKKLGFAPTEAIERRGQRMWNEPLAIHSKEDLYYGRIPEFEPIERHDYIRGWPDSSDGRGKQRPRPYHWATGSGDIAPCTIPGHGDFAVDFKTMNARMFATGPSPDYVAKWECQGNVYMDFFDLDRILFVGICKDSPHDMKEWVFERNQELIDAIYLKWNIVSECLDEGIEPPEDEAIHLPLKGSIAT